MGQEEILKLLKAQPTKWFTTKDLKKVKNMNMNRSSVFKRVRQLIKYNEVESNTEINGKKKKYRIRHKS